jgi:RNA polymerase sigma factor (sigma-70 family)
MKDTVSAGSDCTEQPILCARARGEMSCDAAFDQFYRLYAPIVKGWVVISARREDVEDIFQDVWIIFYRRWRAWRFLPEMEAPEAKPVLSFLYRTFRFSLEGYRRRGYRRHESLDGVESCGESAAADGLIRRVEAHRCLEIAQEICSPEEMDILMAKMAGLPAREIAVVLSVTESVVDHRFRNSITRLQKRLKTGKGSREDQGRRKTHA